MTALQVCEAWCAAIASAFDVRREYGCIGRYIWVLTETGAGTLASKLSIQRTALLVCPVRTECPLTAEDTACRGCGARRGHGVGVADSGLLLDP